MNRGFYAELLRLDIKIMPDLSEGKILYKYVPEKRKDYLDENHQLLRFTQPGALNDPFECCPGLSVQKAQKIIQLHGEQNPQIHGIKDRPGSCDKKTYGKDE